MSRERVIMARKQLHVQILSSQYQQLEHLSEVMGKDKTNLVGEALSAWFSQLNKAGVK